MVLLGLIRQVSGLKSRSPWSAHRRDEMAITLHAFALIGEGRTVREPPLAHLRVASR